ncbi:MAG: histidine kinase [Prevotellaceae bacterium]|nr:histidine kinase [Prevotellaceae bacterium]
MKHIERTRKFEVLAYLMIWLLVFITSTLTNSAEDVNTKGIFDWSTLLDTLKYFLPYFILFWIHDILIAPLLLKKNNKKIYAVCLISMLVIFTIIQCASRPYDIIKPDRAPMRMEMAGNDRPPLPKGMEKGNNIPPLPDHIRDGKPDRPPHNNLPIKPMEYINLLMAAMMCGLNIAVKLYFRAQKDENALKELESQNLRKELEYLKYQINPHFFMNTLNNIHALIDISPEKAKKTIIELSKLMRYVLYEGAEVTVPLTHDIEFVKHYITLMELRYTDKVDIRTSIPEQLPDVKVPPMLLITFVENAFKHGISYRKSSFIHISIDVEDDNLVFHCANSRAAEQTGNSGGIGLVNAEKRLRLIYADRYSLKIDRQENIFDVLLKIPLYYG